MADKTVKTRPKYSRILRGAASIVAVFLAACGIFFWWVWTFCVAQPPRISPLPPIVRENVVRSGDYLRIGESFLREKDGILRAKLVGDPYTRGFSIGRLAQPYIESQEVEFVSAIREHVPNAAALWLLKVYVTIRNRHLPEFVSMDDQIELAGYVSAYEDKFAYIGPAFHRKLNYHAAHDIGHALIDNPLVGCTSFAAWGGHTTDGHLIMGRSFDFDVARSFDTNKVVYFIQPEKGLSFIYVAWPGMIGVVSGMNEARIAVTLNAGQSDDVRTIGTPVALVAREVMQNASSLEEAVAIIRDSTMFVSESFLLADGKSGRAIVVEKSPLRCEVRQPEGERIICANHFLSETFQKDKRQLDYLAEGTSTVRFDRMNTLVDSSRGKLSPEVAASILRDRVVPGHEGPVVGNPAAINMLAATHAVVFDVTDGVIWVSAAPHQLGQFVPFGLDDFEDPAGRAIIPADPMLSDGEYERYQQSQAQIDAARSLFKKGQLDTAIDACENARRLNPTDYQIYVLLAKIALKQGKTSAAADYVLQARGLHPAYGHERRELDELMKQINPPTGR